MPSIQCCHKYITINININIHDIYTISLYSLCVYYAKDETLTKWNILAC